MKLYLGLICLVLTLLYTLINLKYQVIEKFGEKHPIILIIPIRDREKHLKELLNNLVPILEDDNIDYRIFIIEQNHKKKFNKGMINNIGFLEATRKFSNISNIFFHDVDNYPLRSNIINYHYQNDDIKHFFGFYDTLGGIYYIPKQIYKKINGFSNQYFGWGLEDTDLLLRTKKYNIKINRSNFIERRKNNNRISDDETFHKVESKETPTIWKNNQKLYRENKDNIQKDGIKNCKYKVLSTKELKKNIFRILVEL